MSARCIPQEITHLEDVIDSRDIIERIQWLADAQEEGAEPLTDEELAELADLRALASEGEDYAPDWSHGETLIRDSHFVDYAKQLAEDIGAFSPTVSWPFTCIDWHKAARELQVDYTAVEFRGTTYWIR